MMKHPCKGGKYKTDDLLNVLAYSRYLRAVLVNVNFKYIAEFVQLQIDLSVNSK